MKRFTNHPEPWGEFIDVKFWPEIKHPERYAGKELFLCYVTDPYQPLEETACRYGAERLALDLERVMMDFPLPCPSGCGTPLTREELLALREKHPSSVYFSRELMAKYFTYSAGSGTHFVLFDDAETLRQKVKLAQNLGIQTAFLMFPEMSDLVPEL